MANVRNTPFVRESFLFEALRRKSKVGKPLELRGRDLDTFLLAGICNVGNGSALYVALPAQIVELGPAVHRTAIVPHDEVVYPPAMGVNEMPLCRVPDELINQRTALVLGHAKDLPGM
jgi:hypothetical protein